MPMTLVARVSLDVLMVGIDQTVVVVRVVFLSPSSSRCGRTQRSTCHNQSSALDHRIALFFDFFMLEALLWFVMHRNARKVMSELTETEQR
jgi:hypothetical protein